jgi:hypothetical protein
MLQVANQQTGEQHEQIAEQNSRHHWWEQRQLDTRRFAEVEHCFVHEGSVVIAVETA